MRGCWPAWHLATPLIHAAALPPRPLLLCRRALASACLPGRLDAEVLSVTRRVGELLRKLPADINPVNLEELRRIKQALVELENKVRSAAA